MIVVTYDSDDIDVEMLVIPKLRPSSSSNSDVKKFLSLMMMSDVEDYDDIYNTTFYILLTLTMRKMVPILMVPML